MKKYKPTSGKKYVPIKERQFDEAPNGDSLTFTPQNHQTDESEISQENEPISNEELISETSAENYSQNHQEKSKRKLWSPLIRKEIAKNELPQPINSVESLEEEREPMQTNTQSGLNSVSAAEPSAVITKMMVITGDVQLDTSLLLAGKVTGNIHCDDHIEIRNEGAVEGNITAQSIKLSGGNIKGNITCEGTLETDKDTVITGDISAKIIVISGKVNGEIHAKESVLLSSTAAVKGDLYSAAISVEKGALLEGKYSVSSSLE